MDFADKIRRHLPPDPGQLQRRRDLLAALLHAFTQGGQAAVTEELIRRLDAHADAFGQKLDQLQATA